MSQGFLIRYSPQPAAAVTPRFSVRGTPQCAQQAWAHGQLHTAVVQPDAAENTLLYFCGQLNNLAALAGQLADRGLAPGSFDSAAACVRALYRYYGAPGLRMLDGLFVGAFIEDDKLVAFASKTPGPSLYYHLNPATGGAVVCTELKSLAAAERRLRPFNDLMAEADAQRALNTCLHEVFRVRAGHCVEITLGAALQAQDTEYYSARRAITLFDPAAAGVQLRAVLRQAVHDLPGRSAYCLVSGGLDSSIVAHYAQQRFDALTLFSLGTPARNEFAQADAFGASIGLPVQHLLIDDAQFMQTLPELVALTEHCFSTFTEYLIPVHLAHQQTGHAADIMLSGYGSDVLFAGFAQRGDALRQTSALVESEYASTGWANEASQCLGGATGLNIGYPFFDSRVVDTAFAIDPALKHLHGVEKYVLREAFRGVLDDAVIARRKVGIHQGTGCEDYFTAQLQAEQRQRTRRVKDALCYLVLEHVVAGSAEVASLDMPQLQRAARQLAGVEAAVA